MARSQWLSWLASFALVIVAFLAPSPIQVHPQDPISSAVSSFWLLTSWHRSHADTSLLETHPFFECHGARSASWFGKQRKCRLAESPVNALTSSAPGCPSNMQAQKYYTSGTYTGKPGIEDQDNWAKMFQDYMGVPYTSEWETETWNNKLIYSKNDSADPTHLVMYHWHRYTKYTPAFDGIDEHLLFATPLNGNVLSSKNPYTEWANMHSTVAMAPVWTNRWRSNATAGGGGPRFGCPSMETSFQLLAYRGQDLRDHNYHWVLYREIMEDGIIYASVRWIEVTEACKNDYKTCPPWDPINEGLFGSATEPKYAGRLFTKSYDDPYVGSKFRSEPSLVFEDAAFIGEVANYSDTKIFVHEYFNRTSFVRKFKGYGYTGFNHTSSAPLAEAFALI